jgi:hypothetical protein
MLRRRRGLAPRGNLRRRNQRCSLSCRRFNTRTGRATRLFLMAASQGATDAQIAYALRQGLPHLTDPSSVDDQSFGQQPQGIGIHTEQGKKDYEQKKRTLTTREATQTPPFLLAADAFVAAQGAVPAEDWCRTWAAGWTIMLRRTSKRFQETDR